ncbi:MAG: hypothetical protein KDH96_09715 [Candidatus Riesia sp.]|nr:hypothetical protein [Candidatus Riesia sp.]
MNYLQRFNENKIYNPYDMMVGHTYKITEPVYDDYGEGLEPETDLVEIIRIYKGGIFILKNIEHGFTYRRTVGHLKDCIIETVE